MTTTPTFRCWKLEMATAPSDSVSQIKDLLTCSFCLETLNEPKSLPCFHNFCKVCLGKYVEGLRSSDKDVETFPCPTCRSEFTLKANQDVAGMASNYFINNMLEIVAIQREAKLAQSCSCCGKATATKRCVTCKMYMCDQCSSFHAMWPVMKDHDVLSVQDLGDPESQVKMKSKLYCLKHEDKVLEYYCETCKELSCIHCMVLNHTKQNHTCFSVDEVGQKQKDVLETSCRTLDARLSEGEKALDAIGEVMKSLQENVSNAKKQMKEQKEKILKDIEEKLDAKLKKMGEYVDHAHRELYNELSEQYDEIKEYLEKVQASVSFPRNLLKRGSIEEIISSQKVIDENIEKLRKEQPKDLAPVNDGDIKYVPEDVDGNVNFDEIVNKLPGYVGMYDA